MTETLNELVRDLTKIGSIPKSEARRRIEALILKAQKTERQKMLIRARGYWYHAGIWHIAECNFLMDDEGVCNCNSRENRNNLQRSKDGEKVRRR